MNRLTVRLLHKTLSGAAAIGLVLGSTLLITACEPDPPPPSPTPPPGQAAEPMGQTENDPGEANTDPDDQNG